RMRSERCSTSSAHRFQSAGEVLQDLAYEYDLAGNITAVRDYLPGHSALGEDVVDRTFAYDPLARLVATTGRETEDMLAPSPWEASFCCTDAQRTRTYSE